MCHGDSISHCCSFLARACCWLHQPQNSEISGYKTFLNQSIYLPIYIHNYLSTWISSSVFCRRVKILINSVLTDNCHIHTSLQQNRYSFLHFQRICTDIQQSSNQGNQRIARCLCLLNDVHLKRFDTDAKKGQEQQPNWPFADWVQAVRSDQICRFAQ